MNKPTPEGVGLFISADPRPPRQFIRQLMHFILHVLRRRH
jgi:hypothetical protein